MNEGEPQFWVIEGGAWYFVYAYALGAAFVLSLVLTALIRRVALRWNIVDHPGERKMHAHPMPLMGGIAIFLSFYIVIFGNLLLAWPAQSLGGFAWFEIHVFPFLGENIIWKLVGIFAGGAIIFLLGVVDDLVSLKPEQKLFGQIAAALVLVLSGIHIELFMPSPIIAQAVTVLWIVTMVNSMNFLDNMDGLCGGVSIISAFAFFGCLVPHGDTFVCVLLMVFAGAVGGFLYHNLNPARIFMGDAGAMLCGYILATVAVLGTFYTEGAGSRIAVAAPLLALSVPLFDTITVVYIRWRNGESIMKGDKRHFSHRLVDAGMTPRQAVEFIFVVAAVNGIGAVLLPQVSALATLLILAQAAGVFVLIVLLMQTRRAVEGAKK